MNSLPVLAASPSIGEALRESCGGLNPHTLATYQSGLKLFAEHAGTPLINLFESLVEAGAGAFNWRVVQYRDELLASGLKPSTVSGRLYAIRKFLEFLRFRGTIDWTLKVKNPKSITLKDTRGITPEEFRTLLAATESVRDRAIIRLMYSNGLRRFEVSSLDLEHLEGDRLWIHGKARMEREPVSIPAETVNELAAWVRVRGANPGALFLNAKGTRLSPHGVNYIIKKLADKTGINIASHDLRRGAITEAGNITNGNIVAMQTFARHSDPKTTMRYNVNREDVAGQLAQKLSDQVGE